MSSGKDVDKLYVKKHKLNDLLNDLYITITKEKPENPIIFAIEHLKSKLPQEESEKLELKSPLHLFAPQMNKSSQNLSLNSDNQNPNGVNLLAKLMDKNQKSQFLNDGYKMNPPRFSNLDNIMRRIDKIIVKTNKYKTEEELIEEESIRYIPKGDWENENKTQAVNAIGNNATRGVYIAYKNDLKVRELEKNHKIELRKLVENEREKSKSDSLDAYENRPGASSQYVGEPVRRKKERNENQSETQGSAEAEEEVQLWNEILTANYCNLTSKVNEKENNKSKVRKVQQQTNRSASIAPLVQLVICQLCSRAQNPLDISNQNIDTKSNLLNLEEKQLTPKENVILAEKNLENENNESGDGVRKDFFDFLKPKLNLGEKLDQLNLFEKNEDVEASNNFATARSGAILDDENIESASQVSGPRAITPFEAVTNRSESKPLEKQNIDEPKESGVLGWLLSRQQVFHKQNEPESEFKSPVQPKDLKSSVSEANTIKGSSSQLSLSKQVGDRKQMNKPANGSTVSNSSQQKIANRFEQDSSNKKTHQSDVVSAHSDLQQWKTKSPDDDSD